MKNKLFILFAVVFILNQSAEAQNIKEVTSFSWNKTSGLPYIQDYSGNYGIDVYTEINENQYAFLSRTEKKIFVFNSSTKQKIKEIELSFFPIDFAYADKHYFVAGTENFYILTDEGKVISKRFIADKIKFTQALKVINSILYLIDIKQNTWSFDKKGYLEKQPGIILNENMRARLLKLNDNQFKLIVYRKNNKIFSEIITDKSHLGTVQILGLSNNKIIVEVQKITQEIPLKVDRYVKFFSTDNLREQLSVKLPDVQYIYVKHSVAVNKNNVDFLITTPKKASIYKLTGLNGKNNIVSFPDKLYDFSYHYNQHLLKLNDETDALQMKNTNTITRAQIIANAEPYAVYSWYCNPENIKDYDCGGVHVTTPAWVTVGNNISVPYMWGGFSSLPQFDQGINDGVSAGDCDTNGGGSGSGCAVGVDCSGFVSRAWDLPYKYSTSSLPSISTQYSSFSQLLPGDIVNRAGHHVRLIDTLNTDGSFFIIEASASGTNWRVGYNNYTIADLQNYLPRYYNHVVGNTGDTTAPTTQISSNDWETGNFQVSFTDADNDRVNEKFYHVCYYNGAELTGNTSNGFLHDNFTSGINSQWIQQGSTWTTINGVLNQADQTDANTNIYINVNQQPGTYLYKWRMKISGNGSNRRAGLYFMCDDPTKTQRNNAYMVYFRVDQNTCQIYKSENNSIDLKTSDNCIVNAGEWFDAKIIFHTNTGEIKVYKNNVLVSSWTDANPHISGNSISLRTGEANVCYDDFEIFRSRNKIVNISVGENEDVASQNSDPSSPACIVESVVTDASGNFSEIESNFVNIDWSPPVFSDFTADFVSDTGIPNTLGLYAYWAGTDKNSGISEYYYCIGTKPFSDNITEWTSNSTDTSFTEISDLLKYDSTYYVSLYAINNIGLISDTVSTEGKLLQSKLKIYPNPAGEYLYFEGINPDAESIIRLFDITGKEAAVFKNQQIPGKIYVGNLKTGIYFITTDAGKKYQYKFLKK